MITFPNAKINLGLNILEKRPDGFHNIESVFYPINLCDILEVIESKYATEFKTSGLSINGKSEDNLCLKAYHLLEEKFELPPIKIHLHKIIPMGAGLGGGSSDAAFMLKMLNMRFELELTNLELVEYAKQLGADCSFFIYNNPLLGIERGDQFEDLRLDLSGYYLLIITPDLFVNTSFAYSGVTPIDPAYSIRDVIRQPLESWKEMLTNDFEKSVFNKFPEIERVKEKLYQMGAKYASMSGSGSSVFGIFEHELSPNLFTGKYYQWQTKIQ